MLTNIILNLLKQKAESFEIGMSVILKISGGPKKAIPLLPTDEIEAFLFFKNDLPFLADCLGKVVPFTINGTKAIFCTPQFPSKPTNNSKISTNLSRPLNCQYKASNVFWGQVMNTTTGECRVRSCFIKMNSIVPNQTSTGLLEEIDSWYLRFLDNLTVLSGYNVRGIRKAETLSPIGFDRFELFLNGKHFSDYANQDITINSAYADSNHKRHKQYGISYENLKKAIEVTSQNKKPVIEWYFVMDSLESFQLKNYRKAILDAATAVEIALHGVIEKNIQGGEKFKKEILQNYNSLSKKRSLCKALAINLPSYDYQHQFEKLRNQAIHAGRLPTKEEAEQALKIAVGTLNEVLLTEFETI